MIKVPGPTRNPKLFIEAHGGRELSRPVARPVSSLSEHDPLAATPGAAGVGQDPRHAAGPRRPESCEKAKWVMF